ncbi:MAG: hypothetical protein K8R65_01110 [Nitrospirae bacterium]|nr:hypothetical protein [Nitrospirota bacterium]
MLIFLRGTVPEEYKKACVRSIISAETLFDGPGQRISSEQCRAFSWACAKRLYDLPLDEPSRNALDAYQHFVEGKAPRDAFGFACEKLHEFILSGGAPLVNHLAAAMWTDDPVGAASASQDVAWAVANFEAKDSIEVTCANASEDDKWLWGFSGIPDPVWLQTRVAEEESQARVLRTIVGDPFPE